jgi:hypothetical protein
MLIYQTVPTTRVVLTRRYGGRPFRTVYQRLLTGDPLHDQMVCVESDEGLLGRLQSYEYIQEFKAIWNGVTVTEEPGEPVEALVRAPEGYVPQVRRVTVYLDRDEA